jgi:hypothetical protein
MEYAVYAVLILIHVASAIFWGGTLMVWGFFVIPSILEAGPGGGQVVAGLMKRKFSQVMVAMGGLTILSGLCLYYLRFSTAWLGTVEGMRLSLGGLLALSAYGLGIFRQKPLAEKMAALSKEGRGAEIPPVAAQLAKVAKVVAWHVVAVVVLMAGFRLSALL